MTSKTSSFKINRTILKKTIFRFWPIWALYLVIMIFTMPVSLYNQARHVHLDLSRPEYIANDRLQSLLSVLDLNLLPVLVAVFAIISAVAVFSYLYSARSCNMIHAFPVKRTELFITNYIAGFLFLLVPQVIIFLLTVIVCTVMGIPGISYVALWLVFIVGMSFFFYSLAVFSCMLTGHFFAGFAFFFLFNLFYMIFANLLVSLASKICYGLSSVSNMADIPGGFLSPLLYLSSDNRVEFDYTMTDYLVTNVEVSGGHLIGLYCIPAILLIGLALFLYRRRHLECAAEMTAHKFVKPMTRWMVTVVAALGLALWFTYVFFDDSAYFIPILIIMLVLSSWVVFFVLEMAINKKFKIFKKARFLEWGILLAIMILTVGLMEADLFQVEKRVPQAGKVKGVVIQANHQMVITEPEEIARIIEAHQEIVDSKAEYEASAHDPEAFLDYVNIEYILLNGKTLERNYAIPTDQSYINDDTRAAAIIRNLQEETNSHLRSWIAYNYEDLEIVGGTLYRYNEAKVEEQTVVLDKETMEVLYQAMLKDTQENRTGRLLGPGLEEYGYLNCHINFTAETEEEPITVYDMIQILREGSDHPNGSYSEPVETASYYYAKSNTGKYILDGYFDMYTTCEHTINAMIDLGLIQDVSELLTDEDHIYYYD